MTKKSTSTREGGIAFSSRIRRAVAQASGHGQFRDFDDADERSGCDCLGVLPVFGPGVCVKVCVVLRVVIGILHVRRYLL